MSTQERQAYEAHQDELHYQASMYHSTYVAGQLEDMEKGKKTGLLQGLEKGKEESKLEEKKAIARALLAILDIETLALKTGLSIAEVEQLAQSHHYIFPALHFTVANLCWEGRGFHIWVIPPSVESVGAIRHQHGRCPLGRCLHWRGRRHRISTSVRRC